MGIVRHLISVSAVVILAASLGRAEAAPAPITFFDGDFQTGWRDMAFLTVHPDVANPSGRSSGRVFTRAPGGNPGAYRVHRKTMRRGDLLHSGGLYENALYDPSVSGAIDSIDFLIDLFISVDIYSPSARLIVEQDGTIFYSSLFTPIHRRQKIWGSYDILQMKSTNFDTNPIAYFPSVAPDGNMPDFSSAGSPMKFGYLLVNRVNLGSGFTTVEHGSDNWSVTVNPVPLPAAFVFLASGIAALLGAAAAARRHNIAAA